MHTAPLHSFHIPVMGLGFTIDTPIKVARYGISSVISIIEDELVEQMRKFHSKEAGEIFVPVSNTEDDFRAKRFTAYLNLINRMVSKQMEIIRKLPFEPGNDLSKYFELLPDNALLRKLYRQMMDENDVTKKHAMQQQLRNQIQAGAIDANIMSKVDKTNFNKSDEALANEYSDALASLRGFANSDLHASVIFSAGYNPRLYAYIESFPDFYPDATGYLKKKIVLKVSDYRSAIIQGKILAKKGIWISEFRIESGLNCGGHAFATDGILLGPILEEFKEKRNTIANESFDLCNQALAIKGYNTFKAMPQLRITVQGGIGTAAENKFLFEHYQIDGTGWGSPFLLVPEATNVDADTLQQLAQARKEDYYMSYASPLGIPFNNFRKSTSEQQRLKRIQKGRPGSPCYKKFLVTNTEFTERPICTASRQYQHLKIKQLESLNLDAEVLQAEIDNVTAKDCLCEGLGASALINEGIHPAHGLTAVAICPGPNLAYFSNTFTLSQMVDHIYGRINILNQQKRPNMFVNELSLYVDYLKKEIEKCAKTISEKQLKYFNVFRNNLLSGIDYYVNLIPALKLESTTYTVQLKQDLMDARTKLNAMVIAPLVAL